MPTTAKWALRYPAETAPPDVPLDVQRLAQDVDALMAVDAHGPYSALPAPSRVGKYYMADDIGVLFRDNSVSQIPINPYASPAGQYSMRRLGTAATDAAAGNDPRLSDQRVSPDGSVTYAQLVNSLKPSGGAPNNSEALRAIGSGSGQVASGTDARLTDTRTPTPGTVTYDRSDGSLLGLVAGLGGRKMNFGRALTPAFADTNEIVFTIYHGLPAPPTIAAVFPQRILVWGNSGGRPISAVVASTDNRTADSFEVTMRIVDGLSNNYIWFDWIAIQ